MPPADEAALRRLRELEERLLQLQEENEHLMEQQADATLLGLVADLLGRETAVDRLLVGTLEQVSVVKELPLCLVADLGAGGAIVRHAWLAQGRTRLEGTLLRLSPRVAELLEAGPVLLDGEECAEAGLPAAALATPLRAAYLVPIACRVLPRGLMLFGSEAGLRHLAAMPPVLDRVVEAVAARLENLGLMDELRALNAALDQRVAARTRELTEANRGLAREATERRRTEEALQQSQKLEAIGRLAGGIAHDFNNLLTTILGLGELVQGELAPGSQVARDVATILDAGRHAAQLTRQLLAFSRKQPLEIRPLRLEEICRGFAPMLARLIGEEIQVHLELDVSAPAVRGDRGQLEQVLMNLAVNARDAMPGGGRLSIEVAGVTLTEPAEDGLAAGRWTRLSVADSGSGMTPEVADRAFEPFFTTKPRGQGTGLGLATVYGVVRQHGGHARLTTAPGKGTRFDLFLPATDEVPAPATAPAPRGSLAARGGETVLVVDDEPAIRRVVNAVLGKLGYRVVEAGSGEEALALLDHGLQVHALLSDVVMPGLRGADLAAAFRARRPGRPVLLMSGYADGGQGEPGLADAFLAKPLTPDGLARALRAALDASSPG
jgi:signal transduction histidine kinase